MNSEEKQMLREIGKTLLNCDRVGSLKNDPEGSRNVMLSDTLATQWGITLIEIADRNGQT